MSSPRPEVGCEDGVDPGCGCNADAKRCGSQRGPQTEPWKNPHRWDAIGPIRETVRGIARRIEAVAASSEARRQPGQPSWNHLVMASLALWTFGSDIA
jgi:hypothetical protein